MVADARARHPGTAEGHRLRFVGSIAVPGVALALAYLYVSASALPDTMLVIVFGFVGAAGFQFAIFLWNLVLAPSRMSRAAEIRHAEIVLSMKAELDRKLTPFEVAATINNLRLALRDLVKDAYLGQDRMPSVIWDDRCVKLLAACEEFVAEQRNKFGVALHDAIRARTTQNPLEIGKNPSTIQMLDRVDNVMAIIANEIEY